MMRTPDARDPLPLPLSLEAVLAPLTPATFFASYWLQTFYHGAGSPGRFAPLLPWDELNRILEQHALEPPRLRLVRSGAWIDPRSYTEYRHRGGQARPRLSAKPLTDHLRDGATLIVNDIDGLHAPLTALAESLERHFGVPVGINAYAGWGTSHGFDLHADDHDAFILQVSGSKRWLIYGSGSLSDTATPPPDPLWDQTLRDGDLLYIPRGWRHAAIPLNEPCLHLTVSVANPSAADLLAWLADQLRTGPLGQLCVSRLARDEDRTAFVDRLRDAVLSALEPRILQRYFESSDADRRPAPHFSLPWSATIRGLPPDDTAVVRLTARRPLLHHVDPDTRTLELTLGGRTWRYPAAMSVLLDVLREEGRSATIEKLIASGRDTLGDQLARAFLATLIKDGLIYVVRKTPG